MSSSNFSMDSTFWKFTGLHRSSYSQGINIYVNNMHKTIQLSMHFLYAGKVLTRDLKKRGEIHAIKAKFN